MNPPSAERFTVIFVMAFILTMASYGLDYALFFALRPPEQSPIAGGDPYQLFNLVTTFILFVFNPVVSFLIFYKLGSRISVQTTSDHFRLLTSSFAGGLGGNALGYFGLTAYEAIVQGPGAFGPNTDWLVWSATFIFGLVRGSVDIAFLAFTGVIIGGLRSAATGVRATTVESATPAGDSA